MNPIREYNKLMNNIGDNPKYPLDLLQSIKLEFEKGINGGIIDMNYLTGKLKILNEFVDVEIPLAITRINEDKEIEIAQNIKV